MNSLELSPSILEKFIKLNEPFLIFDSKLYTLDNHFSNNNQNYWSFNGKKYSISEADYTSEFRDILFDSNSAKIEQYMSLIISDCVDDMCRTRNLYSDMKDKSFSSLVGIIDDIYSGKKVITVEDLNLDDIKYPTIEDLKITEDKINEVLDQKNVFFTNRFYALNKNATSENGVIHIKGHDYHLTKFKNPLDVIKSYEAKLTESIESVAITHFDRFRDQILNIDNNKFLNLKSSSDLLNSKSGLGYSKENDSEFKIYIHIEPFISEIENKFYIFSERYSSESKKIKVGSKIKYENNKIRIDNSPSILNGDYYHPFVFSTLNICYNGSSRWSNLDLNFSYDYSIYDKTLPTKIAVMFNEAEQVLTRGYFGSLVPVKNISYFNPIATSLNGAKKYAKKHNISENRIFRPQSTRGVNFG